MLHVPRIFCPAKNCKESWKRQGGDAAPNNTGPDRYGTVSRVSAMMIASVFDDIYIIYACLVHVWVEVFDISIFFNDLVKRWFLCPTVGATEVKPTQDCIFQRMLPFEFDSFLPWSDVFLSTICEYVCTGRVPFISGGAGYVCRCWAAGWLLVSFQSWNISTKPLPSSLPFSALSLMIWRSTGYDNHTEKKRKISFASTIWGFNIRKSG